MKKSTKKSESKTAQAETSVQKVKKTKGKKALKDSPDVSTHTEKKSTSDLEKGNPDETLTSNVPEVGRKLGLEDLSDVIDSTENMHIDTSNETNVNDFVGKDPNETDIREDVGPDVETSLGQPSISIDVTTTSGGDKDLSFETAPETDANSGKSVENSISEEGE